MTTIASDADRLQAAIDRKLAVPPTPRERIEDAARITEALAGCSEGLPDCSHEPSRLIIQIRPFVNEVQPTAGPIWYGVEVLVTDAS